MSRIANTFRRLLLEQDGWGRVWTGLGIAIALAGGGLVYQQVQPDTGCEFPDCFPDATNTGVPSGTSLTPVSGTLNTSSNSQVIEEIEMEDGCIVVQHHSVTIRNSLVKCVLQVGTSQDTGNPPTHVYDVTVVCDNSLSDRGFEAYNALIERVDITVCENGLDIRCCTTLKDSYLHDLGPTPIGEAHVDGIQTSNGSDMLIEHNTILSRDTSAIAHFNYDYPLWGEAEDWTITENLLGAQTSASVANVIYCPAGTPTGAFITNNHFKSEFPPVEKYSTGCDVAGITWSGNVIHETGDPVVVDQDG